MAIGWSEKVQSSIFIKEDALSCMLDVQYGVPYKYLSFRGPTYKNRDVFAGRFGTRTGYASDDFYSTDGRSNGTPIFS